MRVPLILLFLTLSTLSIGQSKKDIIEELQLKERRHLATIDSFNLVLNSVKTNLSKEKQISKDFEDKITKLNFESADLRMVMYKYVASIDSLNSISDSQQKQIHSLEKENLKCKEDKDRLNESLKQLQPSSNETTNTTSSPGGTRKIVKDLNIAGFKSAEKASFKFLLYIDEYGSVIRVELVAKNSTDKGLLEKLKREIKSQVRYNANPGSENIGVYYSCTIKPT